MPTMTLRKQKKANFILKNHQIKNYLAYLCIQIKLEKRGQKREFWFVSAILIFIMYYFYNKLIFKNYPFTQKVKIIKMKKASY